MARARHEPDAQALDVVIGIAERVDLELASVARAGVDVADGERATERAQDLLLQARCADAISAGAVRARS
jgi:hypothetical protein